MRTSNPASVARFSSVSVIASGLAKLLFKSEIADWRSLSPNELIICSVLGVADADGAGDFAAEAELFAVGAEDGAGVCPNKFAASKNAMAVVAVQFNIAFIVSWSPR
jgi:hypothetical protein